MKKVLQKISIASVGLFTPVLVFAQVNTGGISQLLLSIHGIISQVIPVLIALGVLGFMWGIVLYLFGKQKEEGKMFMIWGIIALFVMTSVWGLVGILRGTLFGSTQDNVRNVGIPQIR
jgi:hypothetical protein